MYYGGYCAVRVQCIILIVIGRTKIAYHMYMLRIPTIPGMYEKVNGYIGHMYVKIR